LAAGRARVIRQMLTEALPVAILAGIGGLLVASEGVAVLVALAPKDIPRIDSVTIGGPVILYAWLITLATIAPLRAPRRAARHQHQPAPRKSTRARLRGTFVVSQVAVSVILIAGAATLARGFIALNQINPGFQRDHVLTFRITLSKPEHASQDARKRFYQDLLYRLREIPGVQSAAAIFFDRCPARSAGIPASPSKARARTTSPPTRARTMSGLPRLLPHHAHPHRRSRISIPTIAPGPSPWPSSAPPRASILSQTETRLAAASKLAGPTWLKIVGVAADVRYRRMGDRALRHLHSLPAASAAPNRFRDPHRAGSAQADRRHRTRP